MSTVINEYYEKVDQADSLTNQDRLVPGRISSALSLGLSLNLSLLPGNRNQCQCLRRQLLLPFLPFPLSEQRRLFLPVSASNLLPFTPSLFFHFLSLLSLCPFLFLPPSSSSSRPLKPFFWPHSFLLLSFFPSLSLRLALERTWISKPRGNHWPRFVAVRSLRFSNSFKVKKKPFSSLESRKRNFFIQLSIPHHFVLLYDLYSSQWSPNFSRSEVVAFLLRPLSTDVVNASLLIVNGLRLVERQLFDW